MNPLLGGMCSDTQLHNTAKLGIHGFNPIKSGLKMLTGKLIRYLESCYEEVKKPFIAENQRHSQHTSSTFIVGEYGSAADINALVVATLICI